MSDVLFTAAVANRSGIDIETTHRVISETSNLIREIVMNGTSVALTGVGKFDLVPLRPGSKTRTLRFTPVGRLQRVSAAEPPAVKTAEAEGCME